MRFVLLLGLAACAPDITTTEQRQRTLEGELATLDREVRELRESLTEAGIEVKPRASKRGKSRRGKAKSSRSKSKAHPPVGGEQAPKTERSAQASVTAVRSGDAPTLSIPGMPKRTETECGYRLDLPALKFISDYGLNSRGLGKSGPVVLEFDGSPLTPHAFPADYEKQCGGAFRHAGTALLFSPPEQADLTNHEVALTLDPRVPTPRADGRPMYWVYPGTELVIEVHSWDPSWGPAKGYLAALVSGPGQASFTLGDTTQSAAGPATVEHEFTGSGPFEIRVSSPEGGPYVLLDALTIGNPDNAVVITGGRAWRAQRGG